MRYRTHAALLAIALLVGLAVGQATAGEPFLTHDGRQLVNRGVAPRTLAERVSLGLQMRGGGPPSPDKPSRLLGWMSRLPRSVVHPRHPRADHAEVLQGRPRESNPIDVALLLGHLVEDLRPGDTVMSLGTALYASSLLVGLAHEAQARVVLVDIDPRVADHVHSNLSRLAAAGHLPGDARWEFHGMDAAALPEIVKPGSIDRLAFGFAVPAGHSELLPRSLVPLLAQRGRMVVPIHEDARAVTQQLYLFEPSGNRIGTGDNVSFERGVFGQGP